jgi:hypothetical protein
VKQFIAEFPLNAPLKAFHKLFIDTEQLYGYSCGAGQIEIHFHISTTARG